MVGAMEVGEIDQKEGKKKCLQSFDNIIDYLEIIKLWVTYRINVAHPLTCLCM